MKRFFISQFLIIQLANVFCQSNIDPRAKKVFNKAVLSSYSLQSPAGKKAYLPTSAKKLLVFVFLSPECPLSKNYSLKLLDIKKKYDQQVSFVGIIPGNFSNNEVVEFQTNYLSTWTLLKDKTLRLTHYLQGKVTPEVLVINNQNGLLIYKGAIDDWVVSLGKMRNHYSNFYLNDALNDFLNNKRILVSYHKPVGCFINDF